MKIVFFGTSTFACPALEVLADHVGLVVSQCDKPVGRGMKVSSTPVKKLAEKLGIPVLTPDKASDPDFIQTVREGEYDLAIVAAYGKILKEELLATTKRGFFNLHGSILPAYRGAAPVQYSIMNGDSETGVTLMKMDEGMDTGNIIDIVTTEINPEEMINSLYERLAHLAGDLIKDNIESLFRGDYKETVQDEEKATFAPKILRDDCVLDFNKSANDLYNLYRSVYPKPGVTMVVENMKFPEVYLPEISASDYTDDESYYPGTIVSTNPHLIVACGKGFIMLNQVLVPGKKAISGSDFARGYGIKVGSVLPSK